MTGDQKCFCCGKRLPEGHLRYVVTIKALADFDGVLPELEGNVQDEIEYILAEAEEADADDLEKDVHQEVIFFLCKRCKEEFMSDPFEAGEELTSGRGKTSSLMH